MNRIILSILTLTILVSACNKADNENYEHQPIGTFCVGTKTYVANQVSVIESSLGVTIHAASTETNPAGFRIWLADIPEVSNVYPIVRFEGGRVLPGRLSAVSLERENRSYYTIDSNNSVASVNVNGNSVTIIIPEVIATNFFDETDRTKISARITFVKSLKNK